MAVAAIALAACKSSSYVVVTVSGDLVGVQQLDVQVSDGVNSRELFVPESPRALTLPQSFTLEVPSSWSRPLVVSLTVLGAGSSPMGRGAASETPPGSVRISVTASSSAVAKTTPLGMGITSQYPNGVHCATGADCLSGHCSTGICCDTACAGACMTCVAPGTLGTCTARQAGVSSDGGCPDQGAGSCGLDGTCDGRGACRLYPPGTECSKRTCDVAASAIVGGGSCDGLGRCQPAPTIICAPYACDTNMGACFDSCTQASQCVSGNPCVSGSCGKKMKGSSCKVNGECASGFCADGACCNVACTGPCQSCALPGRGGTCWPVDIGDSDPHGLCQDQGPSSCGTNGRCDGVGACQRYESGTVCEGGACTDAHTLSPPRSCDGRGVCQAASPFSCFPYTCSGASCRADCVSDADCAPGALCLAGSCGLEPKGGPCSDDGQCATRVCSAQGVCCDRVCDGPCESCTLASNPGTCSFVARGGADPSGMCTAAAATTCGTTGLCDGAGACALYGQSTVCATGVGEAGAPVYCDGMGRCGTDEIAPPLCDGDAGAPDAGSCGLPGGVDTDADAADAPGAG